MLAQIYHLFHGIQKPKKHLISLDIVEYTISITLKLLDITIPGL